MPDFLQKNWRKWTKQYISSKNKNPKVVFSWYQFQNKPVNQHLKQPLKDLTKNHCSFCDGFPMGKMSRNTIEHFRPKSKYPELSYCWTNLFIACDICQEKNDNFDKLLLKPDALDYEFSKYFIFDFLNGEIKPNPKTSKIAQERAKITIDIYGLNNDDKPIFRKEEYEDNEADFLNNQLNIDKVSYRFMYKI